MKKKFAMDDFILTCSLLFIVIHIAIFLVKMY